MTNETTTSHRVLEQMEQAADLIASGDNAEAEALLVLAASDLADCIPEDLVLSSATHQILRHQRAVIDPASIEPVGRVREFVARIPTDSDPIDSGNAPAERIIIGCAELWGPGAGWVFSGASATLISRVVESRPGTNPHLVVRGRLAEATDRLVSVSLAIDDEPVASQFRQAGTEWVCWAPVHCEPGPGLSIAVTPELLNVNAERVVPESRMSIESSGLVTYPGTDAADIVRELWPLLPESDLSVGFAGDTISRAWFANETSLRNPLSTSSDEFDSIEFVIDTSVLPRLPEWLDLDSGIATATQPTMAKPVRDFGELRIYRASASSSLSTAPSVSISAGIADMSISEVDDRKAAWLCDSIWRIAKAPLRTDVDPSAPELLSRWSFAGPVEGDPADPVVWLTQSTMATYHSGPQILPFCSVRLSGSTSLHGDSIDGLEVFFDGVPVTRRDHQRSRLGWSWTGEITHLRSPQSQQGVLEIRASSAARISKHDPREAAALLRAIEFLPPQRTTWRVPSDIAIFGRSLPEEWSTVLRGEWIVGEAWAWVTVPHGATELELRGLGAASEDAVRAMAVKFAGSEVATSPTLHADGSWTLCGVLPEANFPETEAHRLDLVPAGHAGDRDTADVGALLLSAIEIR